MQTEIEIAYSVVIASVIGFLSWDKRQDKMKLKELWESHSQLRETVARQDERQKMLVRDVSEIKSDTKEIIRLMIEEKK